MAGEEEQVIFHDFLGLACHPGEFLNSAELQVLDASEKSKRDQVPVAEERGLAVAGKSASTSTGLVLNENSRWAHGQGCALPVFQNHETSIMRQAKRRDSAGMTSPQEVHIPMDVDVPGASLLKVSRLERLDDKRVGYVKARSDLSMQPPQVSLNLQSSQPCSLALKQGVHMALSNRWDNARYLASNNGTFMPAHAGLIHLPSDKLTVNNTREAALNMPGPPADEGSRTGLKGSSVGVLLNNPSTSKVLGPAHNSPSSGRSKSWSQNAASESMCVAASQQTSTPTSRQLTIFYGGQAHVFDDVPSDKADAIVTLAGSSGRSWSTMYTPHSKASVPGSESKPLHSTIDGEKSTSSCKASAVDCAGQSASEGVLTTRYSLDARSCENQVLRNRDIPSGSDSRGVPELP